MIDISDGFSFSQFCLFHMHFEENLNYSTLILWSTFHINVDSFGQQIYYYFYWDFGVRLNYTSKFVNINV